EPVFRIAFLAPQIGPNTGNAVRTAAATGCELHLIKPLGFEMTDRHLRRAGLDYLDLATVVVHESLEAAWSDWGDAPVHAFDTQGTATHSAIGYQPGDVLLFGTEHDGLPRSVVGDTRLATLARI